VCRNVSLLLVTVHLGPIKLEKIFFLIRGKLSFFPESITFFDSLLPRSMTDKDFESFYGEEFASSALRVPVVPERVTVKKPTVEPKYDPDCSDFNSDEWVEKQLREQSIKGLIEENKKMVEFKEEIDTEIQKLVSENYQKFISATDMIRLMKDNVESMQEKMDSLMDQVSLISNSSNSIEDAFTPSRKDVEKLLDVSQTLKKLEFLLELPSRLKRCIQKNSFDKAVHYYQRCRDTLQQYNRVHFRSFDTIRQESEKIIEELKITLRNCVRDVESDFQKQLSYSALLLSLGESVDTLLVDLFAARRTRLQRYLDRALKSSGKSSEAAPAAQQATSVVIIGPLNAVFLEPFLGFAKLYIETLVRQNSEVSAVAASSSKSSVPRKSFSAKLNLSSAVSKSCESRLISFTREVFADYFNAVRSEFIRVCDSLKPFVAAPAAIAALQNAYYTRFSAILLIFSAFVIVDIYYYIIYLHIFTNIYYAYVFCLLIIYKFFTLNRPLPDFTKSSNLPATSDDFSMTIEQEKSAILCQSLKVGISEFNSGTCLFKLDNILLSKVD
jgi:hypothetical protein